MDGSDVVLYYLLRCVCICIMMLCVIWEFEMGGIMPSGNPCYELNDAFRFLKARVIVLQPAVAVYYLPSASESMLPDMTRRSLIMSMFK